MLNLKYYQRRKIRLLLRKHLVKKKPCQLSDFYSFNVSADGRANEEFKGVFHAVAHTRMLVVEP